MKIKSNKPLKEYRYERNIKEDYHTHGTCSTFCLSCFVYFHNLPSVYDHPRLLKSTKTAVTIRTLLEGMPAWEKHKRGQEGCESSWTAMQDWSQMKGKRLQVWKNMSLIAM